MPDGFLGRFKSVKEMAKTPKEAVMAGNESAMASLSCYLVG